MELEDLKELLSEFVTFRYRRDGINTIIRDASSGQYFLFQVGEWNWVEIWRVEFQSAQAERQTAWRGGVFLEGRFPVLRKNEKNEEFWILAEYWFLSERSRRNALFLERGKEQSGRDVQPQKQLHLKVQTWERLRHFRWVFHSEHEKCQILDGLSRYQGFRISERLQMQNTGSEETIWVV